MFIDPRSSSYKTLYLSALGAAIPHLTRLVVSLPSILPFSPDEIRTELKTGTVTLHDEVLPDDEDEDITLRKREKSSLSVIFRIGNGDAEEAEPAKRKDVQRRKAAGGDAKKSKGKERGNVMEVDRPDSEPVLFQEPVQDDDEDEDE